jgi:3-(3-hydroxy-phenyl)propionate hydroxylase
MLLPGEDETSMTDPAIVQKLIAPWLKDVPHRLIRAATYRFHGLVAKEWRRGRIFLAGDAAHQTPPFFGQGMCHGFRDAANLVWKLDLVHSDKAAPDLLDTYQEERDPQVRHVIGRAVEVGRTICILDPQEAAERDRHLRSQTGMHAAAELIVPIASRIVGENAGERFINPRVAEGFLDDLATGGWLLITQHRFALSDGARNVMKTLGVQEVLLTDIDDVDGHIAQWFRDKAVEAALVRPDHYLALACTAESLSPALVDLGQMMGPVLPN